MEGEHCAGGGQLFLLTAWVADVANSAYEPRLAIAVALTQIGAGAVDDEHPAKRPDVERAKMKDIEAAGHGQGG